MVQLKDYSKNDRGRVQGNFNSFMVQLKGLIWSEGIAVKRFQFLHGTIKSEKANDDQRDEIYFNSFMVQLKVYRQV